MEGGPGALEECPPGDLMEGAPSDLMEGAPGDLMEGGPGDLMERAPRRGHLAVLLTGVFGMAMTEEDRRTNQPCKSGPSVTEFPP